jgi:hypothetical protein
MNPYGGAVITDTICNIYIVHGPSVMGKFNRKDDFKEWVSEGIHENRLE